MMRPSSQPWPWNKIKPPTPADWGIGMTVCIAALSFPDRAIVCAFDMMVSTGDMSGDDLAMKSLAWNQHWTSMLAGNDLSPVAEIKELTIRGLHRGNYLEKGLNRPLLLGSLRGAIQETIDQQNETESLRPLGLTLANYRDEGPKLGDTIYQQIIYEMRGRRLDVELLCAGWSDEREPHIFSVDGRGREQNFDTTGFWAIGTGQTNALGYLFTSGYRLIDDLGKVFLHACYAKFYAESAMGVGKKTVVVVLRPDHKYQMVMGADLDAIRAHWDRRQERKVSPEELDTASKIVSSIDVPSTLPAEDRARLLVPKPSAAQKSGGRQ